ncbi:MAG TPA: hypothetical protein VM889_05125 [Candidatus Thermoplasmatota archaeon]|nr:hypothetical protein [Candidatus Thermoplasmatota archaeon]
MKDRLLASIPDDWKGPERPLSSPALTLGAVAAALGGAALLALAYAAGLAVLLTMALAGGAAVAGYLALTGRPSLLLVSAATAFLGVGVLALRGLDLARLGLHDLAAVLLAIGGLVAAVAGLEPWRREAAPAESEEKAREEPPEIPA